MLLHSPIGRLRIIGLLEGISYLLLLFVAMPLRSFMNIPEAVTISGMIHGVLFILYVLAIARVWIAHRWPITQVIIGLLVAFIPGGNFLFDRKLKHEQQQMSTKKKSALG